MFLRPSRIKMKYPINVERISSAIPQLIMRGIACVLVGTLVGLMEALVGYFPRPETLVMLPVAAITGGVVGGALGLLLCYSLFFHRLTNNIFYSVAVVAAGTGILSALIFRIVTKGEGAWLAQYPTILVTIVASIWVRLREPASLPSH
jgi:hypothetical protein